MKFIFISHKLISEIYVCIIYLFSSKLDLTEIYIYAFATTMQRVRKPAATASLYEFYPTMGRIISLRNLFFLI